MKKMYFATLAALNFLPVFQLWSQDTIYYTDLYAPLHNRQKATFMEVKKCDTSDLSRCVVSGYWVESSQIRFVERYSDFDNGILDGRTTYWHKTGNVMLDIIYSNGQKHGTQKAFYPSGQLKQKVVWERDSIVSGSFFNEDGTPKQTVYQEDLMEWNFPFIRSFPRRGYHLARYLLYNVIYPEKAKEENIQGKVVVGFVLEKDGSLSNLHVVESGGVILDKAALQVLTFASKHKWYPKKMKGIPVSESFTFPINFALY